MSRRKQSNPKPLKSGDEETWAEEDQKPDKDALKEANTYEASRDVKAKEEDCSSPTIVVKIEGPKALKIEPDLECGSERPAEGSESVIKRNPTSVPAKDCPTDLKSESVKNELIASPVPALNTTPLSEQEFAAASQTLQSALSGPRYFTTMTNTAAAAVGSAIPTATILDPRYRPETLDIRQGYLCPPCGIRFSSLSTLEAHQTYYCSHRQKNINKGGTESEGEDGRALSSGCYDQDEGSCGENMNTIEPASKNVKTGKQYRCTHCSYSADKKVSLNRHMRMHSVSPASSVQNDSDSSVPSVDCYCRECDIRFSNLKTFRAHKLHYCSTRNVIKRSLNANPSTSPALPADSRVIPPLSQLTFGLSNHNSSQTFVALPTNPVLIVPYSLIQTGSVLSGPATSHLSSQDAVFLLLPDGSIQIVTQGIVNQNVRIPEANSLVLQPLLNTNNNQGRKESTSPKNPKTDSVAMSNGALDLRTRRESSCNESTSLTDVSSEEEKENRFIGDHTEHENIVCAPSIPLILSTSSNCSTPSPMPLSPLDARPDKQCSPSPKSVIKNVKKLTNGVIHRKEGFDGKKMENGVNCVGSATGAADRLNVNFNLSEMLLAAVSQNSDAVKELSQFTPETIPHFTTLQQLTSAKRQALNPIANMPLLLPPHVTAAPRVLPDLLNPSILPLLTSELAIRLTAGSATPNVPPFTRQGWKCDDCTISFCKYENYVAHKKHYCKTRKLQESSAVQQQPSSQTQSEDCVKTSPIGSPSSKTAALSPQPFSKENTSPAPHSTNVIQNSRQHPLAPQPFTQQFVCSMCGIKFNSLDNLHTHQMFYCSNAPDRNAIAETGGDRSSSKCAKCKILLPVDQLPTHQCTGVGSAASAAWKCPCCLVVCTSTNAIQKHFESHTGVKAFLCTICNYKGNTIRGMRTHIRVHFDKRNGEIMEENYITCLLDEIPSIATVNSNDESSSKKSPTEQEQARSISSSEENVSPLANGLPPAPLVVDPNEDEDEYIEVDELPLVKEEAPPRTEIDDCKSPSAAAAAAAAAAPLDSIDVVSVKKSGPNYCNSCDIKFNYPSTFVAHKKYYCSSHASEVSSPLSVAETVIIPKNMAATHSV